MVIGTKQSPVNIDTKNIKGHDEGVDVEFYFKDINSSHISYYENLLRVDYSEGEVDYYSKTKEIDWVSKQFHFHAPSEHRFDGTKLDAEMHMVMQNGQRLMVVATLFKLQENAEDLQFFTSLNLENIKTDHQENITNVPLNSFFDSLETKDKYTYIGSLTTPPCTENVKWFVVKEPVKINKNQLHQLTKLWAENIEFANGRGNNRKIQPLNGRSINLIRFQKENQSK